MCNEYKLRWVDGQWLWVHVSKANRITQRRQGAFDFELDGVKDSAPEYIFHVFPDRPAPVVRKAKDGELELVEMRWGFPPTGSATKPIVNVRNLDSPYWRGWLDPQWRCLVPVTEFCEWTDAGRKERRWFKLKDEEAFCFAGIWRPWTGVRGTKSQPISGEHLLFAFVTTDANEVVRPIHAKAMPLLLPKSEWENWLNAPIEGALAMQRQGFAAERMATPALMATVPDVD